MTALDDIAVLLNQITAENGKLIMQLLLFNKVIFSPVDGISGIQNLVENRGLITDNEKIVNLVNGIVQSEIFI